MLGGSGSSPIHKVLDKMVGNQKIERLAVVGFAVLLVMAAVYVPVTNSLQTPGNETQLTQNDSQPSTAGTQSEDVQGKSAQNTSSEDGGNVSNDGNPSFDSDVRSILQSDEAVRLKNGSASLQRIWARMLLADLAQSTGDTRYSAASESLNRSLAASIGPSQVDSVVAFEQDIAAVDRLETTGNRSRDRRIVLSAQLVTSASKQTAEEQIAYAQFALNRTSDDLSPATRERVRTRIERATQAMEKGNSTYQMPPQRGFNGRIAAMRSFRMAWVNATVAIEQMDAATTPTVQVTTRGDPRRNGSQAVTGEIRGTVFDIQPRELSNVTLTVDGNRTVTAPVTVIDRRANATFAGNVTLQNRITSVNATAVDSKQSRLPAAVQASANVSNRSPRTGFDVVLFDGDGLPDTYERETLGTDPKDPDSDSSVIAADTADNGIIDGLEDFDDDGLTNYREGVFGTDPFAADTDGDGLRDIYEAQYPRLNASAADTNGDGTPDPEWDPDEDTLTVREEQSAGTHPFINDTDSDNLTDGREVDRGTDPTVRDTDDDGIPDGREVRLGTDPLSADSDGDGVEDGKETFETTATNESLGVGVTLSESGRLSQEVTIENGTSPIFDREPVEDAQVTPWVNLESTHSFESANVTFEYTDEQLGSTDESDLAVFRYNETINGYEMLPTAVDAENNTVTGRTEHFSRFVVFDVQNWAEQFTTETPATGSAPSDTKTPVDVVTVIDTSESIDNSDPNGYRKDAAKRFVGALLDIDRAGVIEFSSDASVEQQLTSDFDAVNASVDGLEADGGTDIGDGIHNAIEQFDQHSTDSRPQAIILLTDGKDDYDGGTTEAELAAERGITIHTIGFGSANETELQEIAETTGGSSNIVDDASDLPEVFSRVAKRTTNTAQDSDGDGIPDEVERRGVPTSQGLIKTDPYVADTDGDGLDDGEELGSPTKVENLDPRVKQRLIDGPLELAGYDPANARREVYVNPNSDPAWRDTDGDGVDDYTETTQETPVAWTDSKSDTRTVLGEGDPEDADLEGAYERTSAESDPWDADTDGDGVEDGTEWRMGTNPEKKDTDGDGIPDGVEVDDRNDPTLYDARPPQIEVQKTWFDIQEIRPGEVGDTGDVTYTINLRIQDEVGVERAELVEGGEVQTAQSLDGTDIHPMLEYTDPGVSVDGVDTDSAKSAVFSSFGSTADATGDVLGTVGDSMVGTTVYVNATDANGNSRRRVGIQRASAYGEMAEVAAESVETDTPADSVLAYNFGQTTGVSASLGVTFTEISSFIDDPTAFVEGVGAMVELVKEEEAGALETLVEVYAQQLERKQDQNNPYEVNTTEHDSFKTGWYTGYSAGFLMKEILGSKGAGAAKNTLTSVNRVENAVGRLKNTGAITALSRANSAVDAAKAQAVARIVTKASDDAAEPLVSQADTAGQAYRLWRLQKKMDADVSDLPAGRQADIGRYLKRTGTDGRDTYNAVAEADADAAETLVEIENPAVQRQFVQTYQDTDVDGEAVARALNRRAELNGREQSAADELVVETGNDGAEFLAEADDDTVQRIVADGGTDSYEQTIIRLRSDDSVDSGTIDDVYDRIATLDGQRGERAKTLVDETGADGVRFIDDHDSSALRNVLGKDDVGTPALQRVARQYGDLDASDRQTFRQAYDQLDDRGKRELIDNLGTTQNPSKFTTGLERMRSSSDRTLDEFYDFEAGNAVDARRNVLVNVGRDSSSITADKAYQFSDDVRALESNPDVSGVGSVVDDVGAPPGYVENIVKGGLFEIRFTKHYVDTSGIPDGATVKMDYNLDGSIDIGDSLGESTKVQIIRDIELPEGRKSDPSAGNTYSSLSNDEQVLYDNTFTEQTQLDTVVVEGPDGGQQWVYYEAKSGVSDNAVETADIQRKLGRARALVELSKQGEVDLGGRTVEISSVEMRLASPKAESDINANALDVLRNSDGQDPDNDLIREDIPWGDGDSGSATEQKVQSLQDYLVTVSSGAVAVGGA